MTAREETAGRIVHCPQESPGGPDLAEIKAEKTLGELLYFGILNVDKPAGPTSYRTGECIQRALGADKMAHYGTLDPAVTGVLPVALNRACKLARWFLHKDKTYVGIMRIHADISDEDLAQEMQGFVGTITQVPPVRSRVKRRPRQREVYFWELTGRDGRDAHFRVRVQAGTYIRKLIHDMGENIGGAHMVSLRRTQAGIFTEDCSSLRSPGSIERAAAKYREGNEEPLREALIPGEAIGCIMPTLQVNEARLTRLLHGRPVRPEDVDAEPDLPPGTDVALFAGNRFVEVARIVGEQDILARPQFVFT